MDDTAAAGGMVGEVDMTRRFVIVPSEAVEYEDGAGDGGRSRSRESGLLLCIEE